MQFIVVEDRRNTTLECCVKAAERAGEPLIVLDRMESPDYEVFRTLYRHASPNPADFEMKCFRRYFWLNEYCRVHPTLNDFVLIDSDLMLFRDASKHIESRIVGRTFLATAINFAVEPARLHISPHFSYWTRASIAEFCAYLLETYGSESFIQSIDAIVADLARFEGQGGISDMVLLSRWSEGRGQTDYVNYPSAFGTVDHNLNMAFNGFDRVYRSRFRRKRLIFEGGDPYFVKDGARHRAVALHFQGFAKSLMPHAIDATTARFFFACMRLWMREDFRSLKNRLKRRLQAVGLWDRNR